MEEDKKADAKREEKIAQLQGSLAAAVAELKLVRRESGEQVAALKQDYASHFNVCAPFFGCENLEIHTA